MEDLTSVQREAIRQLARADAQAQVGRLVAAGYSPERVATMMEEMVDELAVRSWCAHGQQILFIGRERSQEEMPQVPTQQKERRPWWKLW